MSKSSLKKSEKRKKIVEQKRKKTQKLIVGITIIIVIIGIVIISLSILLNNIDIDNSNLYEPAEKSIDYSQTEIIIPVSDLTKDVKFYSYDFENVEIRYFALIGNDGEVHVAFDACDVCYDAKKGYRQNDDLMHCINCGREFSINSIGVDNTAGGCWPSYLPIKIENENIIINKSDLEDKKYMFK